MAYRLVFTKQAAKDSKNLEASGLDKRAKKILALLMQNPFGSPPTFKKLAGDLSNFYSRRINIKHRIVYEVLEEEKIVKIIRMWTHYE